MKKVLSISLGSSKRDHTIKTKILGQEFLIERKGVDGDQKKAADLFTKLDGQYDAFGLGGIDLYIYAGQKVYTFKDAKKLIKNVHKTPTVDGSGLKNTLEKNVIEYINNKLNINLVEKKVLLVSAVDRFGMANSLTNLGSKLICGDLIFALGLPLPIYSLKTLNRVAKIIAPIITQLPFQWVYPTGNKQDKGKTAKKYEKYYQEVDIIAGDYHFIKRYMPNEMDGKIIITNTITAQDIKDLQQRGVKMLITTTPELNNRSLGTNVIEAVLVALAEKWPNEMSRQDYLRLLAEINFVPRVINFD